MIAVIARREIYGLFTTASSWMALAVSQLLLAWLLFTQLDVYLKILPDLVAQNSRLGVIDLVITPTLLSASMVLLLIIPLLGMGSIADEIRSGRLTLILSSPTRSWQLVVGKWLGLWLGTLPLVLAPWLMAWSVEAGSAVDFGRLAASLLGLTLFSSMVAAICIWLSSISEQPITAAAMSWGLLFLLWLMNENSGSVMQTVSLKVHLSAFLQGMIGTQHIAYFLLITVAALALGNHRIYRQGGGE